MLHQGLQEGRCRCRNAGQSCSEQRNCCPDQGRGCFAGTCQPCDVCASGCPFTSIQDAIAAASPGATLNLCPGTYAEPPIHIDRSLTLLGAGPGEDAAILDGRDATSEAVVVVDSAGLDVFLENLRITNGNNAAGTGGGILNNTGGTLTLADSTVSGNTATFAGGGIINFGGTVTLDSTSHVCENEPDQCEGFSDPACTDTEFCPA